jgi:hypothetical protein
MGQTPPKTIGNGSKNCPKASQNLGFGVFCTMTDKYIEKVPNKIAQGTMLGRQFEVIGIQNRCWRIHF